MNGNSNNNGNQSYVFLNNAFSSIDKDIVHNFIENSNKKSQVNNSHFLPNVKANNIVNNNNKVNIASDNNVSQQQITIFQPITTHGTTAMQQSKRASVSSFTSYKSNKVCSPKPTSKKYNNDNYNIKEKFDLKKKIELTHNIFDDSKLILNCVQLINFLDFYFDDQDSTHYSCDQEYVLDDDNEDHQNKTNCTIYDEKSLISVVYPCIACSTKFKYQQTFHSHLNRRTASIRIFCVKCGVSKIFFNKCKLMYHIYWHKINMFEPLFHSIKIESITVDRLNLSKEVLIDFDSLLGKPSFEVKDNDVMQTKLFLKKMLLNKFLLYKCCICDALFFDLNELKQHYMKSQKLDMLMINGLTKSGSSSNNANNMVYTGANNSNNKLSNPRNKYKILKEICIELLNKNKLKGLNSNNNQNIISSFLNDINYRKLQYSTRCSMLASLNLVNQNFELYPDFTKHNNNQHNHDNNIDVLICPECGLTFDGKYEIDNFRLHLIHECFVNTKYDWIQFKCPASDCNIICYSLQEIVAHWSNAHMIKQPFCDICYNEGILLGFETSKPSSDSTDSKILRQILTTNEPSAEINHSPYLTNLLNISEINQHFFEKHRNQTVSLKIDYKCLCKSLTNVDDIHCEPNDPDFHLKNKTECVFKEWRECRKHIISLLAKSLNCLNCLICNKLISNGKYALHLKTSHNLDKITICPKCGPLKNNETSLHEHFLKFHPKDFYSYSSKSCYFRTLKTSSSSNNESTNNNYQLANGFKIYQCVNCRLLFTSETNFLHNCWNISETTIVNNSNQDGSKSNYLSPIFLKFNVNKLFETRLAVLKATPSSNKKSNMKNLLNRKNDYDEDDEDSTKSESNSLQLNKKIKSTDIIVSKSDEMV